MKIRLAISAYGRLLEMANTIRGDELPDNVELIRMNSVLDDLSEEARRLEQQQAVDVFVSSGGNAAVLHQVLTTTPVVTITPTCYDLIYALWQCARFSPVPRVALIAYGRSLDHILDEVSEIKSLLNIDFETYCYFKEEELKEIIQEIKDRGITNIIGGSLALHCAALQGLSGHYLLSKTGIMEAVKFAVRMVDSKRKEIFVSRQLSSTLDFIHEGIVAVDHENIITVCNPSAERILGISRTALLGRNADDVLLHTKFRLVQQTMEEELNQIQAYGNVKVLSNYVPIINDGKAIGALATFQTVDVIEKADAKIRQDLYSRGFLAKHHFSDLIGDSAPLRACIETAKHYAHSDATVLIKGESGTGKELFAQSIHNESSRRIRPFVAVNCAAMPPQLLESELFGYEEGAFTGAKRGGKRGMFELADGGTIFLDEIAEISFDLQARLLRIIEQREVLRVGGERIRPVNIRIIAATNKDLWEMVQNNQFRIDLYYRLNVLELKIPALRERPGDIQRLIAYFLRELCPALRGETAGSISSHPCFLSYSWPGNIRELRNIVERFSVLYQNNDNYDQIIQDFFSYVDGRRQPDRRLSAAGAPHEDALILKVLEECGGNKTAAAAKLGVSRTTLWRKLREIKLR